MRLTAPLFLLLSLPPSLSQTPFPPSFHRGIVLGGDEWSHPDMGYGTPASLTALRALAATGASHVRLLVTGYMENAFNATRVYSIPPPLGARHHPSRGARCHAGGRRRRGPARRGVPRA